MSKPPPRESVGWTVSGAEMLLIRAGHHLRRWLREAWDNGDASEMATLDAALETVWQAKREYRAIRRKTQQS